MLSDTVNASGITKNELIEIGKGRTEPPTNFNCSRQVGKNGDKTLKKLFKFAFGVTPEYDPELVKKLEMANWRGDTLSDTALVEAQMAGKNPMAIIDTMLEKGIDGVEDPSEALKDVWKTISEEPEWLDWDLLERGALAYRRFGVTGFQFQGLVSIEGYRAKSIALPLMSTGQYTDDSAFNRFLLTCNFWTEVSDEGGMRAFGGGWKTAVRVRLLHTLIRQSVVRSGNWNGDEMGIPISQVGLIGAPLLGSLIMGFQMRIFGYRTSNDDIHAILHLWRYITHIMGLEEGFFPTDIESAVQTFYHISLMEELGYSDDSQKLGASFLESFKAPKGSSFIRRAQAFVEYKSNIALSATILPPKTRRFVNAPNPYFWLLIYWLYNFPKNSAIDLIRARSKRFDAYFDRHVTRQNKSWLAKHLSKGDVKYAPQE